VEDVYGTHAATIPSFQWVQDIRDAYAAHKFGAQRQCVVGVIQDPIAGIGIGQLFALYQGQVKSDGPQIIAFMQATAAYLDQKAERLKADLLDEVQKMTPEQIQSLPIGTIRGLHPSEARMSRNALQKAPSKVPTPSNSPKP
jgi:hypothetical protein